MTNRLLIAAGALISILMIVSLLITRTVQVLPQVWIGLGAGQVAFITGTDQLPFRRWERLRDPSDQKINMNWKWEYSKEITGWTFSIPLCDLTQQR